MIRYTAFLFVLAVLAASPASAQTPQIENTIGVGPHIGQYRSNDAEDGAMFFGFQARVRWGRNVGLEVALDYRDTELFDAGSVDPVTMQADVMYVPITASLMVFAPVARFLNPYAVAGIGWYYTITEYELIKTSADVRELLQDDDNFVMGYHFGLGVEVPFSFNFALHADARYLFLGTEIRSIRDLSTLDTDTKNSDGIMYNIGLMLYI